MRTPSAASTMSLLPLALTAALACTDGSASPSGPSLAVADPTLVRVEATPAAFTLKPGATRQFVVTYHYVDGRAVLADTSVRYQILDPAVVRISTTGMLTARVAGAARIVGRRGTLSDTSYLTVTNAPVATVTLASGDVTLAKGDSVVAAATVRDAIGTVLTDRPVTWTSADTTVALVRPDADGRAVVRAVAAGTATVTVASEGRTATLRVTVPAPVVTTPTPPAGPVVADARALRRRKRVGSGATTSKTDRRALYFERDSAGGKFVRAAAVGASGSYGMRARFDSGT